MKMALITLIGILLCKSTMAATTQECEVYFKEVDTYLEKLKSMDVEHEQIELARQHYVQSKKISSIPEANQKVACKQALEVLKQTASIINK